MAITYTQTDLDNLNEALLTGATKVKIGDREIEYRSQNDLLKLIKIVEAAVSAALPGARSPNLIQATFKKGVT